MFKLSFGLVATTTACHHHPHKPWLEREPLWGIFKMDDLCPNKEDYKRPDNWVSHRLLAKNIYAGVMKGWYQANADVISD